MYSLVVKLNPKCITCLDFIYSLQLHLTPTCLHPVAGHTPQGEMKVLHLQAQVTPADTVPTIPHRNQDIVTTPDLRREWVFIGFICYAWNCLFTSA